MLDVFTFLHVYSLYVNKAKGQHTLSLFHLAINRRNATALRFLYFHCRNTSFPLNGLRDQPGSLIRAGIRAFGE